MTRRWTYVNDKTPMWRYWELKEGEVHPSFYMLPSRRRMLSVHKIEVLEDTNAFRPLPDEELVRALLKIPETEGDAQ